MRGGDPKKKVRFEESTRKKRGQKTFANDNQRGEKGASVKGQGGPSRPIISKNKIGPKPSPMVSQLNRHLEGTNPMIPLSIIMGRGNCLELETK